MKFPECRARQRPTFRHAHADEALADAISEDGGSLSAP
jgi:hypothetical protein